MKTSEKIKKLSKEGLSIQEISLNTNTSIQNVYKHLQAIKKNNESRKVHLSDKTIDKIADIIFNKIKDYIK